MSSPLDSLLNLPGVTVEGHSQVEGYICIHLKILATEMGLSSLQKTDTRTAPSTPNFSQGLTNLWSTCIPESSTPTVLLSLLPEVCNTTARFSFLATTVHSTIRMLYLPAGFDEQYGTS
jgi:hypothetical protein